MGEASSTKQMGVAFPAIPSTGSPRLIHQAMGLQGQSVKEKKHRLDGIISDKVYEEIREAELNKYMKDEDE